MRHKVVALAYDQLCTFEFGVAAEIFGLDRPEMGNAWYRFRVAAIEPGPLRAMEYYTPRGRRGLARIWLARQQPQAGDIGQRRAELPAVGRRAHLHLLAEMVAQRGGGAEPGGGGDLLDVVSGVFE